MLTVEQVKRHLRIEYDDEDSYIATLINASYSHCQNYINRSILPTSATLKLDVFSSIIILPELPVVSVVSIAYKDVDGIDQLFTDYYLNNTDLYATIQPQKGFEFPLTDESYENIVITYNVGYSSIPSSIDHAVLLIAGSLYDQRENHIAAVSINKVPVSAEYLLNAYRVTSV